ncbi:hypothetical protein F4803DRAFT_356371 [Xylaria telfairii]|nr:hypothetical protein F4803DRAFT_356371 [Xylaria telfairii]
MPSRVGIVSLPKPGRASFAMSLVLAVYLLDLLPNHQTFCHHARLPVSRAGAPLNSDTITAPVASVIHMNLKFNCRTQLPNSIARMHFAICKAEYEGRGVPLSPLYPVSPLPRRIAIIYASSIYCMSGAGVARTGQAE